MALIITKTVVSKEEPLFTNVCWVDTNSNPPKYKFFINGKWEETSVDYSNIQNTPVAMVGSGTRANRPSNPPTGFIYFDTTISKHITKISNTWVTLDGDSLVWNITKTLAEQITSSNKNTTVPKGEAYSTTLSVATGYLFDDVTVTMGGSDVTATAYNSETHKVSIASATGDITIVATAEAEPEPEPQPEPEPEGD